MVLATAGDDKKVKLWLAPEQHSEGDQELSS